MPRPTIARVFCPEFKVAAVERIVGGERVQVLAEELKIKPQILYRWWSAYDREGVAGLSRRSGRRAGPEAGAESALPRPRRPRRGKTRRTTRPLSPEAARIVELEQQVDAQARKIGDQALEIDFFGRALRHIEASRPPNGESGATPSSP